MNITITEILIILFYFIFLFFIGFQSRKKKDDFFISNKNMALLPVLISILATETSAASLLLFPELGFNARHRFIFLQMVLGYIVGRIIVSYLFIPKFYNSGVVSIYEYLTNKYNDRISKLISALYVLASLLAAGIRLFIAAVGLYFLYRSSENSSYLTLSIIIIISASIATFYSWQGGLRAVIYTDNLQFAIIILGSLIVIFSSLSGNNRPALHLKDFIRLHPTSSFFADSYFFPTALLGGIIITLGSHGTDQTIVQRVLSCRDVKTARNSMLLSSFMILPLIAFFLFIGYLISGSPSMQHLDKSITANGNVFPYYIKTVLPPVVRGFIAIVFLAAAMSSLDSTLHSMSTILKKAHFKITEKISAKNLSLISGFSLLLSALIFQYIKFSSPNSALISLALGATGMIFGPMVAVFLIAFRYNKVKMNPIIILLGLLVSPAFFIYNKFFVSKGELLISWVLPIILSFFLTYFLIYIFSKKQID